MYPTGGPRQPEFDFERMMAPIRETLGRIAKRLGGAGVGVLIGGVIALIVIIWLSTPIARTRSRHICSQRRLRGHQPLLEYRSRRSKNWHA